MKGNVLQIHPRDNVAVAIVPIKAGEPISGAGENLIARKDIPQNHKVALNNIPKGMPIIKYGEPIGLASRDIAVGEWVHTDSLAEVEE